MGALKTRPRAAEVGCWYCGSQRALAALAARLRRIESAVEPFVFGVSPQVDDQREMARTLERPLCLASRMYQ